MSNEELQLIKQELEQFITELEKFNHYAKLLGINAAIEAVKQEESMRRAMEIIATGLNDLTESCSVMIDRTRGHVLNIEQQHLDEASPARPDDTKKH
ncbi:hypothetical protein [Gynuella sp.]|uniref:hypothetical protein n=1 Tax=Gynuella sp. TaxID=2969146 RepID=UPI003D13B3AF